MKTFCTALTAATALAGSVIFSATGAGASSLYLNYSNVVPNGSTISISRLPIILPNGSTIYKDVTIQLQADTNGVVTVNPATPAQKTSPAVFSAGFIAGTYLTSLNSTSGFVLTGPSTIPGSVMVKWVVTSPSPPYSVCGSPSIFYVGPLSAHPYYARLQAAGLTSTEYSYGVMGPSSCGYYPANGLVGFAQEGNLISIASFTDGHGDHNTPVITYTYQQK